MQSLKDSSIKKKLMLVTMLAVMTAMSVACTAFVIYDVRVIKTHMAQHLSTLASVLGSGSIANLSSNDGPAEQRLLKSLSTSPVVRTAVVYDAHGAILATFPADQPRETLPPMPQSTGYQFRHGHLEVVKTIDSDGKQLGAMYLEGDLDFVGRQMLQYAGIVVIVLMVSCGTAYLLASKLQRFISGPVLDLTRTAQDISRQNDYGIRVAKAGDDELGALCDEFNRMLDQIQATKLALQQSHDDLELRVDQRTHELTQANTELSKEVAERVRAERELEVVHREFVTAARRAGMAEIATGVLHNVGNVLNSVNVSASLLASQLQSSRLSQLGQVVTLLDEHGDNPGDFLARDEKGKQIPRFLKVLAEHLVKEDESLMAETQSLITNIEHIKAIIATQQSYATAGGLVEPTDINAILNDAVKLNAESFDRHQIEVQRDFADLPLVLVDKQRVMQIVINLVKNANESLTERTGSKRILTLRTHTEHDRLVVEVGDTGLGIKRENLTRMFAHGFTTKPTGHGFGLHSCANAATEMDGSLSAHSEGEMKGATFILNLPFQPAAVLV
jgi:two-component system, NtrC family, sensor kinase